MNLFELVLGSEILETFTIDWTIRQDKIKTSILPEGTEMMS